MTRIGCFAIGGFAMVTGLLAAGRARAQVACDALPNPIVVTGSADFEPVLVEFAVRIAAETPPATIISVAAGNQTTSCAAATGLVAGTDFGGLPGRYYTRSGTTIENKTCLFSAGQTAHVAISDAFYETCSAAPQPKPADVADVLGPVQISMFVAPLVNTSQYVAYEEAQTIFGCGVSNMRKVAGVYDDPAWVFCRGSTAGSQITVTRNLGLPDAEFRSCRPFSNDRKLLFELIPRPEYTPPPRTIGFSSGTGFVAQLATGTPVKMLAFQARGQKEAYYPDSSPLVPDRKNVLDGHYPLWGYVHFITKTTGGNLGPQASELIGWINGTKTSAKIDSFALEVGAGLIPQCAMKVKRSSDGGPLSPYSPPRTCFCALQAASSRSIPPGCTPCASSSTCPCGSSCEHGFCE